ncbi:MAG: carboxypeptidase regulatory-like domain-containing protein, partial [Deltaproteobacteria bacterium]|nr:carboxypeptidase regulatory-like domain-containing protein [Deltaproteobacteria bacterium]
MKRLLKGILMSLLISSPVFSPQSAFSWLQESEFKNGRRAFLHWPRSAFPLKVTLSLPGTGDIEGLSEFDAVRRALQQWDHLPTADVQLQLGLRSSPVVNGSDRINTIVFREDADLSLVAKTIVTFVTSTGEILDADVVFNEKFSFRMDKPSPENPQLKEIFLEDVAVHELGHLLGGAHSPTYLSSMWFATLAGQSFTDRDDRALISHLYPKGGYLENRIGGKITDEGGKGIFGAAVSAIQTAEGGTLGEVWSAITDVDGTYVIEGVVDGEYVLIVQPLYGSLSNIYGKYYGTTQNPSGKSAEGANSESDFKERYFDRNSSSFDSLFLEPVVARGGMSVG